MSRWILAVLLLLLLAACAPVAVSPVVPTDMLTAEPTAVPTQTSTRTYTPTATPTPAGTWEVVIRGIVYDVSVGPQEPVGEAQVSYDHHSYYPEVRGSGIKRAVTDLYGEYEFALLVHDTDTLVFMVEAQGFEPFRRRFTGLDLHPGGVHRLDLGLTPLPTPTVAP